MQLSQFFLPLIKENPSEALVASHRLMLRSGMIRQISSGIYSWLPLGLKVLKNVEHIIRKHLDNINCQEVLLPCIQPADLWKESGRYEAYGKEMLRIKDRHDHEMLFGPTAEEVINYIFKTNVKSHKELPKNLYQIHWKFRDEIRPRFGVMRGREFLMKDGYSFDLDYVSAKKTYDKIYQTYFNLFKDMGVVAIPVKADTGPIGGDLSHEFHILAETGESAIYYHKDFEELINSDDFTFERMQSLYAAADEKHDANTCPHPENEIHQKRGIEVGHIFYYGTKYSEAMNCTIMGNEGKPIFPHGGCYGIGVSRVVAAIIEASHDDKGIIWPYNVAPFKFSIVNLKPADELCNKISNQIYQYLKNLNIEVLHDDTDASVGSKFATNDLIGIPYQIVIGPKSAALNQVELKNRKTDERQTLSIDELFNQIIKIKG